MHLIPSQHYKITNPKHGSYECVLMFCSANKRSLAFHSDEPICLRPDNGGLLLINLLLVTFNGQRFDDVFTGSSWEISCLSQPGG